MALKLNKPQSGMGWSPLDDPYAQNVYDKYNTRMSGVQDNPILSGLSWGNNFLRDRQNYAYAEEQRRQAEQPVTPAPRGQQGGLSGVSYGPNGEIGMITTQIPQNDFRNALQATAGQEITADQFRRPEPQSGGLGSLVTLSGLDLIQGQPAGSSMNSVLKGGFNNFGSLLGLGNKGGQPNFSSPQPVENSSGQTGNGEESPSLLSQSQSDNPYLGEEYRFDNWAKQAAAAGVTNPIMQRIRYNSEIAPLIEQARASQLRSAIATLYNPDATEEEKMNAKVLLAVETQNPMLPRDMDWEDESRQMQKEKFQMDKDNQMYRIYGLGRNQNAAGSDAGNMVLEAVKGYKVGDQWMGASGDSRNQCANWVSDVYSKIGLPELGNENGDRLMSNFGKAYHRAGSGYRPQPGDAINFKKHVGIYLGDGQYMARNSEGGVHVGTMSEAIKNFGNPIGFGSIGEYTGTNKSGRYDNKLAYTDKEKMDINMNLRQQALDMKSSSPRGGSGGVRGKKGLTLGESGNNLCDAISRFASEKDPDKREKLAEKLSSSVQNEFTNLVEKYDWDWEKALNQLTYDLVGGEIYGRLGVNDNNLADLISDSVYKGLNLMSNGEGYKYATEQKIKNYLMKEYLPKLHGGSAPETPAQNVEKASLNGKPPYREVDPTAPVNGYILPDGTRVPENKYDTLYRNPLGGFHERQMAAFRAQNK